MWVLDSRRFELERQRQGVSVEQLANQIRVDLRELRAVLQGDGREADPELIRDLACALGVEPIDISTRE